MCKKGYLYREFDIYPGFTRFTPQNSHPKPVQDAKNEFNQFGHQSDYDFVLRADWATRPKYNWYKRASR